MATDDRRYTNHTSEQFNNALKSLRIGLLDMGDLASLQLRNAVDSLVGLDQKMAQQVLDADRLISGAVPGPGAPPRVALARRRDANAGSLRRAVVRSCNAPWVYGPARSLRVGLSGSVALTIVHIVGRAGERWISG